MRLQCLTTRIDRPSTRYRLLQYIPYINSSSIDTEVVVIPKGIRRWRIFGGIEGDIFIQKKLFSRLELRYLRKKARKIIFDFDDAIMYTKSRFSSSTRRYRRFRNMMDTADLVIAGNGYLAGHNDKAVVIPTVIDVSRYPLHSRSSSNVVLGWIGTKSTQDYLEEVIPVLKRLPNIQIKIVSDQMPSFCEKNITWERWSGEREMEQLLNFDIGLMPLREDPWTKGKCGFKIIQYMAAGIPVVCSPVGVNTQIVKDGVNGFLASTVAEWEDRIKRLINDTDLYRRTAASGRETVEKNYNLSYWGPYLAGLLKERMC